MVIYAPDGEKWACEACLKGHRVTSCSHKDRQLFHVNKKGRPVSQCQHCRGLRKARHSHVKCVCAELGIDKEHGLESPFGRRCQCGQGMPCTCAAKRDIDVDDLQRTAARNLTHRRVQSHGAKPVMPNRRSDSLVPRPYLGPHHPPMHRLNNAAHEYGMPYQIKRFTTSTPNISMLPQPSSEDNLMPSMGQPLPTVAGAGDLSTSVPSQQWNPQQMQPQQQPQHYHSHSASGLQPPFSSADYLQPRLDTSFMNNALSPGNPSRYSMNDFSQFQWPGFQTGGMYSNPSCAASADQLGTSNYSDWSIDTPVYSQGNTAMQTPQNRLSVASVEQPGLTHSPSNTVSEAGSSAYPSDASYTNFGSQPPTTINPSFTSKDYFGLDPVSENIGDMPNESFAYNPEGSISMDDIFGAGPGPTEPIIKSEPQDYSMNESFATADQYTTSASGPSLVVPQFNTEMGSNSNYVQYPGPTSAGQQQSQPQYYDQSMGGAFNWDMSGQQSNMS